jgi:hypothetical protein
MDRLHLEQESQILHRQLAQRRIRVLVERCLSHGQLFMLQLDNLHRQLSPLIVVGYSSISTAPATIG